MGRSDSADFVEALARGLDIIQAFGPAHPQLTLAEVATATGLARPTARRLLLTLIELGFVRLTDRSFALTPRVVDLGTAYVDSLGLWDVARPHLESLVAESGESSSMAQLEGSDIVYVARVSVPKIIALRVHVGTRFPAHVTSQGKVLLAALDDTALRKTLEIHSRSEVRAALADPTRLGRELDLVRSQGWALADEELAPGVRSIAVPVRSPDGTVTATVNVTVHSAETSVEQLLDRHLEPLLRTAAGIEEDWRRAGSLPHSIVSPGRPSGAKSR